MPLDISAIHRIFRPSYVININRILEQASSLQGLGHIKEARELLEALLKKNPESKAVRRQYGVLATLEETSLRSESLKRDTTELK